MDQQNTPLNLSKQELTTNQSNQSENNTYADDWNLSGNRMSNLEQNDQFNASKDNIESTNHINNSDL